jgi:hypothetical protein
MQCAKDRVEFGRATKHGTDTYIAGSFWIPWRLLNGMPERILRGGIPDGQIDSIGEARLSAGVLHLLY